CIAHPGVSRLRIEPSRPANPGTCPISDGLALSCRRTARGNYPMDDRITLYGSFTSSSSYKPMLYLALARVAFSFRTVNLKYGVQKEAEYLGINRWGVVPSLRHRGLT